MNKIDRRRFSVSVECPEVAHVPGRKQLCEPTEVYTGRFYGLVQLVLSGELENL